MTAQPPATALPEPVPRPPIGYLDAVAGQPLLPVARRAWLAAVDQGWSDPARLHHVGRRTGLLLDAARSSIAASLGVRPDELFLTSSGPTAAGTAVQGLLARGSTGRAIVSSVESLAITSQAGRWAAVVDAVPVDRTGRIDVEALARALETAADLVCVQAASGEVGTRQPLAEVAALTRAAGVPLLVHAVQVIGRGPVPVDWDVLAASARDWGGPAGVGVLAVRSSVRWTPDENPDRGWVNGFPDVAGAAAAATALEYLVPHATAEAERLFVLTELIRSRLPQLALGVEVVGDPVERLPHIVTFTCAGVTGEAIVHELDRRGISVASGSACTADTRMPSQVLSAMGLAVEASVRVSLPLGCADETVADFLRALPVALAAARSGA